MLNGMQKLRLIRELADGAKTLTQLAEEYEFAQPAGVTMFAKRNAEAIEKAKGKIEDEMDLLWVSSKVNRVATHQQVIEKLLDTAELVEAEKVPNVLKGVTSSLRAVAEEKGELAPKEGTEATKVNVHLHGVDLDKL